ncbi:MAG: WhiB family transcriptional regulator [Mycobacteriaceae bacterium]|nr:WhiB family transcriptional regulator [Mycobacteriaceae bacterium]
MTTPPATDARNLARLFSSTQIPSTGRLFHTDHDLPCSKDPELFFNPHQKRRAIAQCAHCPFRGRCGYNAVATGATHGIWGGVILPGDYPKQLRLIYARLAKQFEQRRHIELGHAPTAPLPAFNNYPTDDEIHVINGAA